MDERRLGYFPAPRSTHAEQLQSHCQRPRSGTGHSAKLLRRHARPHAAEQNPGGLVYTTSAGTTFFLYETEYAGQAGHTIAQWHVDSVVAEVEELKSEGVQFERYDIGVTWDGDVAMLEEMGSAAWFKDSEGNIMRTDDARTG